MTRAIVATLSGVVFLRVLGVSLLFAGFEAHGRALGGDTLQAALAFGAYPLALALFILPLAALSDRVGRRPVMLVALAVSAAGGVLAAFAPTVTLLAIGRFVQGAGAVNGVALALAGETGAPEARTRRMAILGAAAGGGFAAGILAGAYLTPLVGVPALLLGHAALTLLTLPAIARAVPAGPPLDAPARGGALAMPRRLQVYALGAAAFAVNLSLTGLLFLSPLLLPRAAPGVSYAVALTLMVLPGGLGMFLSSRLADRGHALAVGIGAAALLGLAPLAFLGQPGALVVLAGVLYFVGHSALSALLPALAATRAAHGQRGTAQGIQSTLQYLGSFAGAALVGALYPAALPLALAFVACGAAAAGAVAMAAHGKADSSATA